WIVAYNAACGLGLLYGVGAAARRLRRSGAADPQRTAGVGAIVAVMSLPIGAGLLFLTDAVWSEMSVFLHMGVLIVALASLTERWRPAAALWVIAAAVCSYQTRRQMGVLPVVLVATGGLLWLKSWRRRLPAGSGRPWQWIALGLASLLALYGSTRAEAHLFAASSRPQGTLANVFLMRTLACTLGCRVSLYSTDCSTEAGRQQVESATCFALATGQASLGPPRLSPKLSTATLLGSIGWGATLRFVVEAPLRYLTYPPAGTELGDVRFWNRPLPKMDPDWWPEVAQAYGPYFDTAPPRPGGIFSGVYKGLQRAYQDLWLYHALTGILLVACLGALLWSREPVVLVLCLLSVTTFLCFALLNPITPLRYLMQCIVPGFAGVLLGGLEWARLD
ncbi:MAG TPA: hypothetical protein VFH51_03665, partial [Myxococcota bacterium]|nr:hypothetical protein [Myxococcota bacterium]